MSNLALRALTKKIFSMRSYQRPRASGMRRWPGRSGRSRLRRGCGLAASQALASLPRILGRPRLQRKSGRVSGESSRGAASAFSLSRLTARAKSRSGSRDSGDVYSAGSPGARQGFGRWVYRVSEYGPSSTRSRLLPAAGVVHCKYASSPLRPWAGKSPLAFAHLSASFAAKLEQALGLELGILDCTNCSRS